MEQINLSKQIIISIPTWELIKNNYYYQGGVGDVRIRDVPLEEVLEFLERWEINKEEFSVDMNKSYDEAINRDDDFRVGYFNEALAEGIQRKFSKKLLESLEEEFSMIVSRSNRISYNDLHEEIYPRIYYFLHNDLGGVLILEDSELSHNSEYHPEFILKSTKEIDLNLVERKIKIYLNKNWNLPKNLEKKLYGGKNGRTLD